MPQVNVSEIRPELPASDGDLDLDRLWVYGYTLISPRRDNPREVMSIPMGGMIRIERVGDIETAMGAGLDILYTPTCCGGSDYSGSEVERANYRYLSDNTPAETTEGDAMRLNVYGGHGSYDLAYNLMTVTPEVWELLSEYAGAVSDYPIADEAAYEAVTQELEEEAWDGWAASDFARALAETVRDEDRETVEDMSPDDLWPVFWSLLDQANGSDFFETGGNWTTSPSPDDLPGAVPDIYACPELLMALANAAAMARGHGALVWVIETDVLNRRHDNGTCPACGMTVSAVTAPRPNETHISGEALALDCTG